MYSDIALKIYALTAAGEIKSRAIFWNEFADRNYLDNIQADHEHYVNELKEKNISLICCFDDNFPKLMCQPKKSEKPYLFAYRGNINLLNDISNNIAVIGVLEPTDNIIDRECKLINKLAESKFTIVSGLAKGCDTLAHKVCLQNNGNTIAILPSTMNNIYPKENSVLAESIVNSNGLILTEYITESKSKYETIGRFIDRDRLQAMFAQSVVLVASFRHGEGDSGSRHAMKKAKEYNRKSYVMFNDKTDKGLLVFGLNELFVSEGVPVLTEKEISDLNNEKLRSL